MTTWQQCVHLQMPTFVPFATTKDFKGILTGLLVLITYFVEVALYLSIHEPDNCTVKTRKKLSSEVESYNMCMS